MYKLILPNLGEGIESAVIAEWGVKPGDKVIKGQEVLEVVTDKANFNVSCEESGTVKEIFFHEGENVAVGETIALIYQ